jgi:integrase/recombinase XerD
MTASDLDRHLDAYLALRSALGFAADARATVLRDFVAHAAAAGGAPIRAATALAWACDHAPARCGVAGKAHRLTVVRGFLAYLAGIVPGTQVPDHGLIAGPKRRRPYILSEAEIAMLIAAAAKASPRGALRPVMLSTLLGLLASTGLRIGEAVRLTMADVRLAEQPANLWILKTKLGKSRLVTLHPTTAAALAHYCRQRERLGYHALSDVLFVSERGGRLDIDLLGRWFAGLAAKLGLAPAEGGRRPSLHSFRHSFAVRRLQAWYAAGEDVAALLPRLSVYLGHTRLEDSYWYLTATPELLRHAGARFVPDPGMGDEA